jgi:acetolactate synthase I/II/III large subunit
MTAGSETFTGRGAEAIVRVLRERGVDVVFGMCGHGDLTLLDAFADSGIRFISVHHEQVAVHAADAYYRVSHRPGVVVTTLGPGALNTATGLGDAMLDSSAVLVISGAPPSRYRGLGAYQEIELHGQDEQAAVTRPLVKRTYQVSEPKAVGHTVARAWQDLLTGSPGPVHVHVPLDFYTAEAEHHLPAPSLPQPPGLCAPAADAIAARLRAAQRPVIYAGGGAVAAEATDALRRVAQALGAPVVTSMVAQGVLPEDHPLALGFTGVVGTQPANTAVQQADVLLAVGTRFPEMDTSSWRSGKFLDPGSCELIQVDVDQRAIGRYFPTSQLSAVADARIALEQIAERLETQPPARPPSVAVLEDERRAWATRLGAEAADDSVPMQPARILAELRRSLPRDAVLVTGVGVRHLVGQHYPVLEPRTMLVASGFSTMGWETGAALGAAVAADDRPVVGLIGDGAFNSTVTALSTAVAYDVPVLWVILDNGGYQSIGVYQDRHFGRRLATDFLTADGARYAIDYVGLARAYGADGEVVDKPADLPEAIERGLRSGGNYLLHVPTSGHPRANASGHWDVNDIMAGDVGVLPAPLGRLA